LPLPQEYLSCTSTTCWVSIASICILQQPSQCFWLGKSWAQNFHPLHPSLCPELADTKSQFVATTLLIGYH
jgi:hypothetical protein